VKWPWSKPKPSVETVQAQERLEKVYEDDERVNDLSRRTRKLAYENGLARDIIRALEVRK